MTGLGAQAALVALPYQVYVQTGSALLTGLMGAVELGPMAVASLFGGAYADRHDRRGMLAGAQAALVVIAGALATCAFVGWSPLGVLYVLAALLAGFSSIQHIARTAMIPNLAGPEHLRPAVALSFGMYQLSVIVGPALGGLLIGVLGVGAAYVADMVTCVLVAGAVASMAPQLPRRDESAAPQMVGRSILDGLRFVRGNRGLLGSFAIDLSAMTFGMPRALFPVLALSVYDAGAAGTGLLHSSVATGATVAALTTGWLTHTRRLGRVVVYAVLLWGASIALVGAVSSLWVAAALLVIAGGADSVSAVARGIINQTVTPDHMRGRMTSIGSLVVTSGPRLGDVESGVAAALLGPRLSVTTGGLACIACVGVVVLAFPELHRFDTEREAALRVAAEAA